MTAALPRQPQEDHSEEMGDSLHSKVNTEGRDTMSVTFTTTQFHSYEGQSQTLPALTHQTHQTPSETSEA